MDSLEQPKLRKVDIRYGKWNVRSLYRAGSLITAAREITKYRLDLVRVQYVRWDRNGTKPEFFYGNKNVNHD
jgi:hypothetical protein